MEQVEFPFKLILQHLTSLQKVLTPIYQCSQYVLMLLCPSAGQDYAYTTQIITFPPSTDPTSKVTVPVPILNNNNIAGESKTFLATLTSTNPAVQLVMPQATINIINNNGKCLRAMLMCEI